MNHVAHNTAMRSAQRQHDNASPDDCDDLAEQIHSEYLTDADKCAEADANWSGTLDGSQYSDIETALADLHSVDPSDLLGSDVLARVYRLAKVRSEEHTSELQSLMRNSYAVFCLKKKKKTKTHYHLQALDHT